MELAAPFIANDRRIALAQGAELPERADGAALFADISGFTPLAEALAAELGTRRGAEELTKQLDIIYGAIIGEVDRFRGSVIGFAGDAITCWFDGDDSRRAIACALAMQAQVGRLGRVITPSGEVITLALKVAVAAGPVRRLYVGTPAVQYIDTLAGATLYRMAAAEHQAEKGEVVVAPEVVARLGDGLLIAEWRHDAESRLSFGVVAGLAREVAADPWPALAEGALADELLRPWLHATVYERLAAGQGRFLAELRPAVALFMRFPSPDFDADEAAGAKLDAFIQWVQAIIARHEGALIQLTIGDKGSFLYCAFGAPLAHDDDPDRAVAAALELRRLPEELSFISGVQIGISRGRMRVGAYGGPTARTYGVLGDEVNLAARLMGKAAPGEILVSQRVADAVTQRYDLQFVGPINVKGKREPVLVTLVLGRRATQQQKQQNSALIGRESELAQMAQMVEAARLGSGQLLRVEGPLGIGKSRLAAELLAMATTAGFKTVVGISQIATEGVAYAPWRQTLCALLGLDDGLSPAGQIAQIEREITAANPLWLLRLPLLGDLLDLPIPDNATTAAFEPSLRQRALYDLVIEIIQTRAAQRPLLVLLDNVHAMDEASQRLTLALANALPAYPIALVVLHRPPLGVQPILPGFDELPHGSINLADLSPAAVGGLIHTRLEGPIAPLVLALVQEETQGNPFFVEELVSAMVESGGIVRDADNVWDIAPRLFNALRQANCLLRDAGAWTLAPDASLSKLDLGLPDSIEGVVISRLDRLPEGPKLTLKVASVIGDVFALDLLVAAHPLALSQDDLSPQMAVLEQRDFTRLEQPAPDITYTFRHNVTHDVAYQLLLFEQRRDLHQAVGVALEQRSPQAVDQLAYHTYLGEDWPKALGYQLETGRRAQRLFANHAAIDHFEKALRCTQQLPADATILERQQIHSGLGQLLTSTGQYEPALEQLHVALALAEQLGDPEAQARACRWIARVFENKAEYPPALDWIGRGLEALGLRETTARAEMLAIAGLISTRQGNYEHALELCAQSAALAEALGDKSALAFSYNARAIIAYQRGISATAIDYFQRALAAYEQADNIHGQAMSSNGIGNSFVNMGQWPQGEQYLLRAQRIFLQSGDVYNGAFAENNLGEIARFQGRFDDALGFYNSALRILQQLGGSKYALGVLHMNLGATHARRGAVSAARQELQSAIDLFELAQARDYLPEVHRHLAEAAQAAGDIPAAEAEATLALEMARELAMDGEEANSLHVLGQVAAQRDPADAEQLLLKSMAILAAVSHEYELATVQLTLAELLIGQGRAAEGAALLDQCATAFTRLDARPDLATVARLRSQLPPENAPEA